MARGGHELRKVSPGSAMPDPYGRFRGDPPAGRAACGCLLPFFCHTTPYAYDSTGDDAFPRDHRRSGFTFTGRRFLSTMLWGCERRRTAITWIDRK
jgi:hypothetical protein